MEDARISKELGPRRKNLTKYDIVMGDGVQFFKSTRRSEKQERLSYCPNIGGVSHDYGV